MPQPKHYSQNSSSDLFAVVGPEPPMMTSREMAAIEAANERVEQFYREDPEAEAKDIAANDKLSRWRSSNPS